MCQLKNAYIIWLMIITMTFAEKILLALYNVSKDKGPGGYRISELMPEGGTLMDARDAARRLMQQGYITIPQGLSAGPIIFITEEGCEKAQQLLM